MRRRLPVPDGEFSCAALFEDVAFNESSKLLGWIESGLLPGPQLTHALAAMRHSWSSQRMDGLSVVLRYLLDDPRPYVREGAAHGLVGFADDRLMQTLFLDHAMRESSPAVMWVLICMLPGSLDRPTATGPAAQLVSRMTAMKWHEQVAAIDAAGVVSHRLERGNFPRVDEHIAAWMADRTIDAEVQGRLAALWDYVSRRSKLDPEYNPYAKKR